MCINQTSILTIISEKAYNSIYSTNDEFHKWLIMQVLVKNNEFRDDDIEMVVKHYQPIEDDNTFLDLQLKLFLVRNSKNSQPFNSNLNDLINYWTTEISKKYSGGTVKIMLNHLDILSSSFIKKYGKYYYNFDVYQKYIESWNNRTVDLKTWKRFKYLSLPDDFSFLTNIFDKQGVVLSFQYVHMEKLFEKYSNEIYQQYFSHRLEKGILVNRDKVMLSRIMDNTASDSEKKDINNIFYLNNSWKQITKNISRCLVGDFSYSEMDINSGYNLARYCALIKYYEVINAIPKDRTKVIPKNYAVWFKNIPKSKEQNDEFYEQLRNVFEQIQSNCPNNTWNDFKSVFIKNGSTVKIEWNGDAVIINYLFRKLHKVLSYKGKKWEVIASYFYKADKTDKTMDAKNLANNTHFNENSNPKFVKYLEKLISTLS